MPEHNTDSRTGLPARRPLKPGEWACVEGRCSQINQESSFVCEGCGKHKPKPKGRAAAELGKQAAEKSKGLFSAEDWMCTKCGNVNWARRNTCNVCNAKKLGDAEQRTGFGGGYNDRQNVEYVKREYDEEFDEFGRKKKRKGETGDSRRDESRDEDRPKLGDVDIDKAFSLEPGYAEDEEEEEDDGDDADLAKRRPQMKRRTNLIVLLNVLVHAVEVNVHVRRVKKNDRRSRKAEATEIESTIKDPIVLETVLVIEIPIEILVVSEVKNMEEAEIEAVREEEAANDAEADPLNAGDIARKDLKGFKKCCC
ncbi:unnamed protein product [Bursaphelenchus xylophilus]|uniref:(pine wood nematode) hypothetical protein n=1 Tax=Bursaphelenchus xylophilus TaxID=6326 RepID=A0A7I8WX11_BURXY|nr:unnamed protein product [Bursaphelenchus xylophilus]CAG9100050.1 unnamed protein product [Bursaphelenchus xylophilus]